MRGEKITWVTTMLWKLLLMEWRFLIRAKATPTIKEQHANHPRRICSLNLCTSHLFPIFPYFRPFSYWLKYWSAFPPTVMEGSTNIATLITHQWNSYKALRRNVQTIVDFLSSHFSWNVLRKFIHVALFCFSIYFSMVNIKMNRRPCGAEYNIS